MRVVRYESIKPENPSREGRIGIGSATLWLPSPQKAGGMMPEVASSRIGRVGNIYFELTEAFNARRPIAVLGSGQAVVYHRLAIMSKDGDWILDGSAASVPPAPCPSSSAHLPLPGPGRAFRRLADATSGPRWYRVRIRLP